MRFHGTVFKYGRDVDTDVIIPARYLNDSDPAHLAAHCLEDLDATFIERVQPGDILSLRGSGKAQLTEVGGQSRKGRVFLTGELWL